MPVTIVVLNDGETYTNIHGCTILVLTDKDYEELASGDKKMSELYPISEIALVAPICIY
jgi:hypothetical protein